MNDLSIPQAVFALLAMTSALFFALLTLPVVFL